jgi:hypothetical protein
METIDTFIDKYLVNLTIVYEIVIYFTETNEKKLNITRQTIFEAIQLRQR